MRSIKPAILAVAAALVAGTISAQKVDTTHSGAAFPPIVRASENTVINYAGGEPALFTGALDADDSTHNRPTTCAALSAVGTATAFDTVTITNNSPGTANFIVFSSLVGGGACGNANDTFFVLYNGSFNPATPLTNCLAVHDDINGGVNRCSQLIFSIPVGETRVLTVSGFNNPPTGLFAYQINFTGTTPVELIEMRVD